MQPLFFLIFAAPLAAFQCDHDTVHCSFRRLDHDEHRRLTARPSVERYCVTEGESKFTYRLNDDITHTHNYDMLSDVLAKEFIPMPPAVYIREGEQEDSGETVSYLVAETNSTTDVQWIVARGLKIVQRAVDTMATIVDGFDIPLTTDWKPTQWANGVEVRGVAKGLCPIDEENEPLAPLTTSPTGAPTNAPTTANPTSAPTKTPSAAPTKVPTKAPTAYPTSSPTVDHPCTTGDNLCDPDFGSCVWGENAADGARTITKTKTIDGSGAEVHTYHCTCAAGYEFLHPSDSTDSTCAETSDPDGTKVDWGSPVPTPGPADANGDPIDPALQTKKDGEGDQLQVATAGTAGSVGAEANGKTIGAASAGVVGAGLLVVGLIAARRRNDEEEEEEEENRRKIIWSDSLGEGKMP